MTARKAPELKLLQGNPSNRPRRPLPSATDAILSGDPTAPGWAKACGAGQRNRAIADYELPPMPLINESFVMPYGSRSSAAR
jgi:hypothetical protein